LWLADSDFDVRIVHPVKRGIYSYGSGLYAPSIILFFCTTTVNYIYSGVVYVIAGVTPARGTSDRLCLLLRTFFTKRFIKKLVEGNNKIRSKII
jgi:hypothetical protein